MRDVVALLLVAGIAHTAYALDSADIDVANSYDDAWEYQWATTMRNVHTSGFSGVAGKTIHVGDSITYSGAATSWARGGTGRTAADLSVLSAVHTNSDNNTDGTYLAKFDVNDGQSPGGSYTAEGGMDTAEYLAGPTGGLPTCDAMFVTGSVSGPYSGFSDFTGTAAAEICFLMLGTNDITASRSANDFETNLKSIVTKIMQNNGTIVCLTTIPPRVGKDTEVNAYNTKIRDLAQNGMVISGVNGGETVYFPLMDLHAAMLYRQPTNWSTTLISADGIHPSGNGAGDAYASSGAEMSVDGYLLRCWLWVQKLKEIRDYCVDGNLPPSPLAADAGPDQTGVPTGATIHLDGSGSTGAATYYWEFLGDGDMSASLNDQTAMNPTFTSGDPGTQYHLQLTVTDGVSDTDTDDMWVYVDSTYVIALIDGQVGVSSGITVTQDGTSSWTWNSTANYSWSVSPVPADLTGTGTSSITFTSGAEGESYVVTLTVNDGLGHSDTDSRTVTVVPASDGQSGVSCSATSAPSSPGHMLMTGLLCLLALLARGMGNTRTAVQGEYRDVE